MSLAMDLMHCANVVKPENRVKINLGLQHAMYQVNRALVEKILHVSKELSYVMNNKDCVSPV